MIEEEKDHTSPAEKPSGELHGRTALITGATSGIGLEAARLFVRQDANVIVSGP
ncbi:SDR family NAD(P)-dependent oxidoreductase [Streptomyces iconiensis]|uniref:SDR family NAD(P)-dependent oxidoreductase n=1 Tax=Streptomyces iconiensis TaxID=1384038 RepID=A0ABT6ZZY9_9ACTN|nr:SDR family NAD(P)-dependent oxidoreductase [Streptomyces iconiensis]MDJ1134171.1 SDR family NAD(P)-dependent oxidoreductase [Streptomyces iconiensis]